MDQWLRCGQQQKISNYLRCSDNVFCAFELRREQEGRAEPDSGQTLKKRKNFFGTRRQAEGVGQDVTLARLLRGQGREDLSWFGLGPAEEDLEFGLQKMNLLFFKAL